ncbi:hypothetical protein L6164_022403 [Bauhinia variegata]|uniref:Uncharacterized protein n=1 Tax=Bauhinia variegata TaxID=167791 RepID=A0ACB9MF41_BAUVA|nr:hypothetical protein L6164_022403 [Bauhinia variegata]
MMKDSSKSKCGSSSHRTMKEKAKIWVDDLQGTFAKLQSARMENRGNDIIFYEQQVHLMLQEWKAELHEPSPASSLAEGSFGLLDQLLQQIEEEDDATSPFAKPTQLKSEQHVQNLNENCYTPFQEKCFDDQQPRGLAFEGFTQFEGSSSNLYNNADNKSDMITPLDHFQFNLHQDLDQLKVGHSTNPFAQGSASNLYNNFDNNKSDMITPLDHIQFCSHQDFVQLKVGRSTNSIAQFDLYQDYKSNAEIKNSELTVFSLPEDFDCGLILGADETKQDGEDNVPNILPNVRPPPSAFLGPKCALWECVRPAEQCQDYCSSDHAGLALNEGLPGITPILRPWGIGIKDGPLFAALRANIQGKEAGIPGCEGAASTKAPWNAPELFDPSLFEGETVREWLFLDKPRKAFESGNRKQRSLPDYNGRWHESRKQLMKEHGGQKRSYYMDPQPFSDREWHLYEYEINGHDSCALYRMELKLVDKKKSPKGKVNKESLADLQNKMGRLTANVSADEGEPVKGKTKAKCDNLRSPEGDKYFKG